MGIFDSIKHAFGNKEPEAEVTVSPSQMLRNAGLDPGPLKFGFGPKTITVSGEISSDAERQKILDVLAGAPGITTVTDNMAIAAPAPVPAAPAEAPESGTVTSAGGDQETDGQRIYTVQSGDTLWKISQEMYGNGSKYMKIFEANTDLLKNPDQIFPGQKLVIPGAADQT